MVKKEKSQKKQASQNMNNDSKLFAFLATFLSILGFLIAVIAKKEDKYVMHYAKQSLVIFLALIIGGIIVLITSPIVIIGAIINFAINIVLLVLWVISWIFALSGEKKEVPLIGIYARKFDF